MTPPTGLQLRSLIKADGTLEVSLVETPVPQPRENEVLLRVEAAPLNPSDLGMLFGPADMVHAKQSGTAERPVISAPVSPEAMEGLAARVDQPMPVGNEGAGVVIAAGSSPSAQALLGKTVACLSGAMYAQFRCVHAGSCLELAPGTSAADGASAFVNPLTALGMTETMRREGHKALVHTAAASSLGQMLHRLCARDGIPLVNIVRKEDQAQLLRDLGAMHVINSSAPDFEAKLTDALAETGATIAFDATGGGKLAGQILGCMESALNRNAREYSRYGSTTHKQVYLYGGLDTSPTELKRNYGMAWGIGGWLVFPFTQKIGAEATALLKKRIAAELQTTFATRYAKTLSLAQLLTLDEIALHNARSTGGKVLIAPNAST